MTIAPRQEWGFEMETPPGPWGEGGELELARFVEGGATASFAVTRGVLYEVLGRPKRAADGQRCRRLPIDMIDILLTNTSGENTRRFATDVVLRGSPSRGSDLFGDVLVVSNVGRYRSVEFSPRSHPNDGRLEVLRVKGASLRERLIAFNRFRSHQFAGTASISVSHTASEDFEIPSGRVLLVDGVRIRDVVRCSLRVLADCTSVYIGME